MKKPIKVLIVGFSDTIGGIETFLIEVIRNNDFSEIKFDVLTYTQKCVYEDELINLGCKVYHITRRGKNPIKNHFEKIAFFERYNDYDFVWQHLTSATDISVLNLTRKYTNAKYIPHSHGSRLEPNMLLKHYFNLLSHNKNKSKLSKLSDLRLSCSEIAGKWLYGEDGSNFKIIPNGIDFKKFIYSEDARKKLRAELNITEKEKVVGFIGRLEEVKNLIFLIEVFYEYYKKNSDSILLIAGMGSMNDKLKNLVKKLNIESNVKFLGFRDDVSDLLQAMDILLLPSFSEGFPVTIVEAQISNLPSLLSDVITKDVKLSEIVYFESLEATAKEWAEEIEKILIMNKVNRNSYELSPIHLEYSSDNALKTILEIFKNN